MSTEPGFFDKLDSLNTILQRHGNAPSALTDLTNLLRDDDVRREFFHSLENAQWIDTLRRAGYFEHPPGAERVAGSGVRFPLWPESRYLERIASQSPSEVATIFMTIETDNASVIGDMVKAALAMPAAVAATLAPFVARAARDGTLWIYFKEASDLCVKLAQGGQSEAALGLAEALFTPTFEKGEDELSRRDTYWYKDGLAKVVPVLARNKPRAFLLMLCDWLNAFVEAKRQVDADSDDDDQSYIWRPAIEEHEQNKDYDFAGVMVGFVRQGFETAIQSGSLSLDEALRIVERYPYVIYKRLRLHLISEFADHNPDLARQTIMNDQLFDDDKYKHEYAILVGRRLDLLSPEQREEWFGWIDTGPDMSEVEDGIREIRRRDATDEDRREWINDWKFEKLHWVRKHLQGEYLSFYDRMHAQHGEPEMADLNVRVSMGLRGNESPMTVDDLASKTFEQAVDAVSSWRPEGSTLTGPSIEGLSSTFDQYVATNPEEFSVKARHLIDHPANFVRGFVSRMREAVETGREIDLTAVLDLCDWVIQRPVREQTTLRQVHDRLVDHNWQWSRNEIARFVRAVCNARSADVPKYPLNDFRQRLWRLIEPLCRDRAESYIIYDTSTDDPRVRDYLDLGINSPRGRAVEAALEYARWAADQLKVSQDEGEVVPGGFEDLPEVRDMLQWQIAAESRSFEALSVIGSRIGLIYWIDKEWLAENADWLFSLKDIEQEPAAAHGWAAWNAFLVWVRPHIDFYRLFKSQFSYAVEQSGRVQLRDQSWHEPMHSLGVHLVILYGRGELPMDDDNGLLPRFLENANPEIRRHAIGFVGQSLEREEEVPAEIIERFEKLWDLYWAGPGSKDATGAPNAPLFGTWFSCGKFSDDWALDRLQQFVGVNPTPEPDHSIAEKLAEIAHVDVVKSVQILDRMVRGDREGWRIEGWKDAAKQILQMALKTPGQARETAEKLIDYLGRRGYLEFGELLS